MNGLPLLLRAYIQLLNGFISLGVSSHKSNLFINFKYYIGGADNSPILLVMGIGLPKQCSRL